MKCCRKDCFAYNPHMENNCNALSDIFFHGKPCTFYRDYQEMADEVKKYGDQNDYARFKRERP